MTTTIPAEACTMDAPMLLEDCAACDNALTEHEGGYIWNRTSVVCDRCNAELTELHFAAADANSWEY